MVLWYLWLLCPICVCVYVCVCLCLCLCVCVLPPVSQIHPQKIQLHLPSRYRVNSWRTPPMTLRSVRLLWLGDPFLTSDLCRRGARTPPWGGLSSLELRPDRVWTMRVNGMGGRDKDIRLKWRPGPGPGPRPGPNLVPSLVSFYWFDSLPSHQLKQTSFYRLDYFFSSWPCLLFSSVHVSKVTK